jgi:S-adenosylmethionine synthetase
LPAWKASSAIACKDIGYEQDKFHWNTLKVHNLLHEQSAHIAQGRGS